MKSRIATRGQVVIPKALRDRLGLKAGQQLDFTEERGRLIAVRVAGEDPVAGAYGSWRRSRRSAGRSTDRLLESIRGKADAV